MGVTIQFESHRGELAGIYELEHDPDAIEYYDQPPAIKLSYIAKNERTVGVIHTPDFFVLRRNSAGWEECKTEEELFRLADRMPRRYVQQEGRWRCPPGESYAQQFGLYYRLRSSGQIDWTYQRNIQLRLWSVIAAARSCGPIWKKRRSWGLFSNGTFLVDFSRLN